MRSFRNLTIVCFAVIGFGVLAHAGADRPGCKRLRGTITWTVVPAPNDPFGRVVGVATGSLKGGTTAIIESLVPGDGGVISTHDLDIFVVGPQDILIGNADAVFTPIPGKPGEVTDSQTITISGGSGKFLGATGSIEVRGQGHDLAGGPGLTFFHVEYRGEVCGPNVRGLNDDGDGRDSQ